ncbi:MAG: 50S ribosomal protein L14 [Candidatus Diapherotrites archaeon CG08_land_8_20_14_0_20_30_16]|nr:MAG: 50S ribosomal protein L14 [Candidatus Diapherotrites archaeon CG08_land_8_20_14_0_20_30_16]
MRAMSAESVRGLVLGSRMECSDNTGAKVVYIISVFGQKTVRRQIPSAGIGDLINVIVLKGKPEMMRKKFKAVIIRSVIGMRRANGTRVKFDGNACVIVDDDGVPKSTEVKGVVPKEVGERFPKVLGRAAYVI